MDQLVKTEREERADHARRFLQFASSFYVSPLFLLFSAADYIWYPDHFRLFVVIRVVTAIGIAILMKAGMARAKSQHIEMIATLFVMGCIWPIHVMIFIIGEPSTPYYAGLELIAVGLASGLRLSWPFYAFNMGQIILPFLIFGGLKSTGGMRDYFFLNSCFMISIAVIMSVSRWFTERLHSTARELRDQLNLEIQTRDQVIALKTSEALELHSLSRQFSPQIVSSLSAGGLKMVDKIHRSEICTVFVDIVGSTNKFITLDRDDLQQILSMYMEDVMGTFLKYDITIDKFLGDGVLGFSNDPVPYPDYIERVLRAALEIKRRIRNKHAEYQKYWQAEFEISFGIATGHASVGFYGSDLHVKSYTAIGRVVNLAARLGSLAGPNEILVSGDVIAKLQAANSSILKVIEATQTVTPVLKGFENEVVTSFRIDDKNIAGEMVEINGDIEHCPHGHGLLFLAQDANGIYFFKCRYCDFVLVEDDQQKKAA